MGDAGGAVEALAAAGFSARDEGGLGVVVDDAPDPALVTKALADSGRYVTWLQPERVGLEEVFLQLTADPVSDAPTSAPDQPCDRGSGMTTAAPAVQPRSAGAIAPLLRAELSRVSHRRLYRICSLLLLAGIVAISVIVFFHSHKPGVIPDGTRQAYEQDLARQQRYYDRCVEEATAQGENPTGYCGEPPSEYMNIYDYTNSDAYRASENLLPVVLSISVASAMLAFLIGASTGGAEWSSRSMTLAAAVGATPAAVAVHQVAGPGDHHVADRDREPHGRTRNRGCDRLHARNLGTSAITSGLS